MPASLSDIERDILEYLVAYLRHHTFQPSIREIGQRFGIRSTKTVSEHLHALSEKGYLERDPSRSRGVHLLGVDLKPDSISVPCFASVPEANEPRTGEGGEGVLTLDRRLAAREGSYFVRAPLGLESFDIHQGDYLLVEPVGAEHLADGDLAAVGMNGTRGFARFLKQGAVALLHGPDFGDVPVVIEDLGHMPLLGRVSALFRRMGLDHSEAGVGADPFMDVDGPGSHPFQH